jgi:hypothetical protein
MNLPLSVICFVKLSPQKVVQLGEVCLILFQFSEDTRFRDFLIANRDSNFISVFQGILLFFAC